ncbi:nitroreductase family protein [Candidatus Pacearchaeota archaeon]|nr:nitroreductase family protein [Candidatus Pacearchaeota archaeon]
MELSKAILSRKSTKRFSGKKVNLKKIIRVLDNIRQNPCAGNMFNLKFIIIQSEETIDKISIAAQQDFIKHAGAVIAVVSDREKIKKMYDYNDKGFAAQQAGAAIQTILLNLTEAEIANCWIGFFDDGLMAEALGTKSQTVEAVIALGEPTKSNEEKNTDKPRPDLENIVFFEKYGNKKLEKETKVRGDWA